MKGKERGGLGLAARLLTEPGGGELTNLHIVPWKEGGREGRKEGRKEGGRYERVKGGTEEEREGGREGGREEYL